MSADTGVTITADHLHVILDALAEMENQIDREEVSPWEGYTGDDLTAEAPYTDTVRDAIEVVSALLSAS